MTFSFLPLLSHTFGWIYTLAWSLSFYPQPLLNLSRRSTSGTTIDFPAINILGFLAYFVSNSAFKYSLLIREQYAERNNGLTPTVQFNDVVFAGHAMVCAVVTTSQYIPGLWGWEKIGRRGERISRTVMGIVVGSILGVGTVGMIVATHPGESSTGWAWIDVVSTIILLHELKWYQRGIELIFWHRSTQSPTSKSSSPSSNTCHKSSPTTATNRRRAGPFTKSSSTSWEASCRSPN